MYPAKVIMTGDETGLEPEFDTFINNIDTGKVFIGDGDGGQKEIKTVNAPLFAFVNDDDNYDVPNNVERLIYAYPGSADINLVDGYPNGKEVVILNKSGYSQTIQPKSGSTYQIDGGASITLADGDSVKIWYYDENYYVV
jgi:ribosomal protein L2